MAAGAGEAGVTPVKSDFISRSIAGYGLLHTLKGVAWGNAVALSQALGTAWAESSREAKAQGKAVDVEGIKRLAWAKTKVFWPSVVGHTVAFTILRGNGDTRGISGALKPLAIVSIPTIAYAAYYRAVPPQALRFGVYSAALLHLYDRVWKPKGIFEENMPTTKLHRRVW